jgi:hypothetical protein
MNKPSIHNKGNIDSTLDKDKYHIHQQAYPFVNGDGFYWEIGIVT